MVFIEIAALSEFLMFLLRWGGLRADGLGHSLHDRFYA